MGDDWALSKIAAWAEQGALTKDRIMARLDDTIKNSYAIRDDEKPVLDGIYKNLDAHDDDASLLTEPAFINLVQTKVPLPRSADQQALGIIYDSLTCLSTLPFPSRRRSRTMSLSSNGLVRALVWALPDRAKSFIEEGPEACCRNETDHHRLIFQSLATIEHGNDFVDDENMYDDLLDVLYSTQEIKHPGHSPVHRETLRPVAKRIYAAENDVDIASLAIPTERFETLTKFLLAMQFTPPPDESSEDFISATKALSACFSQGRDMITWPMFEHGLRDHAPYLFSPYYRLLSTTFLDKSSTIDVLEASEVSHFLQREKEKGKEVVLTRPMQSQLNTFLSHSVYFGCLDRIRHFSTDRPTPASLMNALQDVPDEAILVVSGKLESGQTCTFGLFSPKPGSDRTSIQTEVEANPNNAGQERCVLFQLQPIHNVFKGVVGRPGWSLVEATGLGTVTFGQGGGVVLALENGLRRATVRHGEADTKESYAPTAWREEWAVDFDVADIEIWSEPQEA
ncbi:hypothetical protein GGS20DRAFT_599295 [Poronia punctata]|nr:hypothetical protein GGS20DRAFT_599295 [Poronia punctata]